MARTPLYTGIDIGTFTVKVVIASPSERSDVPMQILGTGTAPSRGMRQGYIVSGKDISASVRDALAHASQAAGIQVKHARVAIGGVGLDEFRSTGEVSLTQSGGTVEDKDIERALRESEKKIANRLTNRHIIHTFPLRFRIDGAPVFGRPQGWHGTKLAVDTLIITALAQHYDDLIEAVEDAGVEVEGVMASPLAASLVTLTKAQKTAGVLLANIGAETTSIAVFENDMPLSVKVLPSGAADVTHQIALNFRVPLVEAEQMKRGAVTGSDVPMKKLEDVITTRLKEMFNLINAHLREIDRARLLPAGIVITGGGSGLMSAAEIARATLKLPSQIGVLAFTTRAGSVDATWAVAYGLCRWGFAIDTSESDASVGSVVRSGWQRFLQNIKNLMP